MVDNLPTVDLGTGRSAKAVAAGKYTTCAILDDDTLKCWGVVPVSIDPHGDVGGGPGQMGDNLKAIDLGAGRKPVAVASAWGGTCVALDDGSFVCWGISTDAVTAVAAPADGARVVQLAGDYEPLGVFDDGSVRRISDASPSGPTTPLDFGGRPATLVAGSLNDGDISDCVVLRTGGTACRGFPTSAPVPTDASPVALALTSYGNHVCGLDASGTATCWGSLESHPEWRVADGACTIPLGQPATVIGAGAINACALLADGTIRCWGIEVVSGDPDSLGGSVATATGISAVDLGTRPAP
jgi:E3 ubiquitin-protein ligase HERC3